MTFIVKNILQPASHILGQGWVSGQSVGKLQVSTQRNNCSEAGEMLKVLVRAGGEGDHSP